MHEITTPTVESPAYRNVFHVYRARLMSLNTVAEVRELHGVRA